MAERTNAAGSRPVVSFETLGFKSQSRRSLHLLGGKMVEIEIYKRKGLEIWFETAEDSIELKSSGVFSKLASPLLKKVNKMLRNEKPIRATEEEVVLSTWLPPIPSGPFRRAITAEMDILLRALVE